MASITKREQEILEYINENPFISQSEIARKTGITRSSVAVHIRNMTTKGFIKGRAYILPDDAYTLSIGTASLGIYGTIDEDLNLGGRHGNLSYGHDGAARNVAELLKMANINSELLTVLSKDSGGQEISNNLNEIKIPFEHSIRGSELPTSREVSLLSPCNSKYTSVMDASNLSLLTPAYLKKHEDYIKGAKAIYLDDALSQESIEFIAEIAEVPIFASFRTDKNVGKFRSVLPHLHGVALTQPILEELCEKPIHKYKELRESAAWVVGEGTKQVFVAVPTGGVYYMSDDNTGRLVTVLDESAYWNGMGEACAAGMMRGFVEARSVRQTAIICALYGKACSETFSPVNRKVDQETIEEWLNSYFPEINSK